MAPSAHAHCGLAAVRRATLWLDRPSSQGYDTRTSGNGRLRLAASIEILHLRFPVHPNITVIQIAEDGPLAGKKVEIPGDNVAAIQWTLDEPAIKTS